MPLPGKVREDDRKQDGKRAYACQRYLKTYWRENERDGQGDVENNNNGRNGSCLT